MKKLVLLALLALPVLVFAQTKATETKGKEDKTSSTNAATTNKFAVTNPEVIFLEIVISETNTGVSQRFDFGRELLTNLQDKELITQLTELRSAQFNSVPDAMNYLASIGFKYVSTYNVLNNGKSETHMMFEKRLPRKGPTGSEKPTGSRPNVDVPTGGSTPSTQPKGDKK